MVFQNPQPRRMEGRFSFQLPIGPEGSAAMPSRLAMEIQGKLMEGPTKGGVARQQQVKTCSFGISVSRSGAGHVTCVLSLEVVASASYQIDLTQVFPTINC